MNHTTNEHSAESTSAKYALLKIFITIFTTIFITFVSEKCEDKRETRDKFMNHSSFEYLVDLNK